MDGQQGRRFTQVGARQVEHLADASLEHDPSCLEGEPLHLATVDAAHQAVRDVRGVPSGRLLIGALQTSAHLLPFASWLAEFAGGQAGLDIGVQQLPALRMLTMVANGELDCAMVSAVPNT